VILPVVWRRRYPVGVFAVLSLVALAQWFLADRLVADLSLLVALYTVASLRPRRTALAAAAVLEVGVGMATGRWSPGGSWIRSLVFLSAMVAAALFLGANVRARRAQLAMLTERAERLEHERDQQARLSAVAERTRIAREMHDVLAHSLAVMVSLADGAAAKLSSEPERAATAIAHVSDLGRQSLRDTRRLLGVLRADDAPDLTTPQPDSGQLDDLVARVRATGLDASLHVSGEPFELAPAAGLTVYRIVQEALTNSLKHAAGARAVRVRLRYHQPELDVDVVDDGISAWPPVGGRPEPTAGHGLAGMRERAAVYRGTVLAGPDPEGGWRVHAHLPVGPGGPP
ncbi:MAG: sensor histidine kinase, partial [Acidimicrobiales bacterium]